MAATEEEGQTVSVLPQQNTAPNPPPPGRAPPPPIPPTGVPPVAVTGPPPSAAGRILPLSSVAAGVPPIVVNKAVVPSPNPAAANLTVANEALLENVGTNTTGILEAITNAIDWSKVVFQNITLVLPESASSAIHSFIERLLSRQLSVEPPVLQPLPTPAPLIQQQQMQQQTPAEAASNQPSTSADQQKTNNETTSPISTTTTVNPPPLGTTIIQTPSFRDSQQQQRQNQNQNQQYPSPVHYGPGAYVPVQQKPLAYFSDSGTTGQQQQYQQPGGTATNTFGRVFTLLLMDSAGKVTKFYSEHIF
jgi:hypothetical protein